MARQPRQQQLTFYLIKADVERSAILRPGDGVREYEVRDLPGLQPALFVRSVAPHPPRWVDYLTRHIDVDLGPLFAASASAVLLFEAAGRLLALTFGQGRHLLDPVCYEQDFGLRVVLNTVAPDQLRSIDAKTTEELTLHTRRDVSRASSLPAFGLDISRDLMRAVTGVPEDESLGRRVSGSDSLAVASRAQIHDLPALGERLVAAYGSDRYKQHFDFIDHLRPVRDRTVVAHLEAKLLEALQTRQIDDLHLAAPEPLDWRNLDGFRFSTQPDDVELETDPRISTYLETRAPTMLTLEHLKQDRVIAFSATDGGISEQWPVHRCIVFETADDEFLYVLSAGDWYRISRSFRDVVWNFVRELPQPAIALPGAELGIDEGAYNQAAAEATGALNLDRQLVRQSVPDPIEICDLLGAIGSSCTSRSGVGLQRSATCLRKVSRQPSCCSRMRHSERRPMGSCWLPTQATPMRSARSVRRQIRTKSSTS